MRPSSCIICCWSRCMLPMFMTCLLSTRVSCVRVQVWRFATLHVADRSAHFADIDELVGEDPACFREHTVCVVAGGRRWRKLDVGGDTPDRDRATEEAAHTLLECRAPAFGNILQERLILGKAESDDISVHR